MEEFYKILNDYLTVYENTMGRNPKRANDMRPTVDKILITLNKFYFLCLGGDYKASEPLFKKMCDLLHVAKLSPLRGLKGDDFKDTPFENGKKVEMQRDMIREIKENAEKAKKTV